jgi:hypothetical protein
VKEDHACRFAMLYRYLHLDACDDRNAQELCQMRGPLASAPVERSGGRNGTHHVQCRVS